MSKSTVLLTFKNFFLTVLCACALCRDKHINGTVYTICNFYVENEACNPY